MYPTGISVHVYISGGRSQPEGAHITNTHLSACINLLFRHA